MTAALGARAHWPALLDAASAPYRGAGRFAWRFARGKLGLDPVFRHLLEHGLIVPNARVLDIGCGQGLLASLLLASARLDREGLWPAHWAQPPLDAQVTGIELMPRDVQRAETALGGAARFVCGDMRDTPFPDADAVAILDVLHYISVPEQEAVLARARRALHGGGVLLLRVGDLAARHRFAIGRWVDALVTLLRRHRMPPQHGRTLAAWIACLEALGLEVHAQPMSRGTPFANVLLVARVRTGT